MGYDVSVRFSTRQERDAMLAFLQGRDWDAIEQEGHTPYKALAGGEDLGYAPQQNKHLRLGFNVATLPDHVVAACVWAACKSSYRDQNGSPVVWHDKERWPIVMGREPAAHEANRIRCDERGVMHKDQFDSPFDLVFVRLFQRRRAKEVVHFIDTLEQDWQAQLQAQPTPRPKP